MKVLICASARAEIVKMCIKEYEKRAEIIVISTSVRDDGLPEYLEHEKVSVIRLKGSSFRPATAGELEQIRNVCFDEAVILSGGIAFVGFDNVVETIQNLHIKKIVFYNKAGRKEVAKVAEGPGRVLEKYGVMLLLGFFGMIRPVELFMERIYIKCAELLGL